MSIKQCRALHAISQHGSFAGAARALNLAQSAISMQIAGLEQTLGTSLFDRTHRPPRLTEAGRVALGHARAVVEEYDAMVATLTGRQATGAFRIGVIPTVLTTLLPDTMIILREAPRSPELTVISALSGDLVRAVSQGELDAAIVHQPQTIPDGTAWRPIARQEVMLIAPATAPEADLATLFASHAYIRFNRRAWVAPMIERRVDELGLAPNTGAEIESIEAIRLLVGLGFGISVIPITGAKADPSLRLISFGDPPLYRQIGLLMRASLSATPAGRRIGDAFADAANPCRSPGQ